jgi:hypothetical protein
MQVPLIAPFAGVVSATGLPFSAISCGTWYLYHAEEVIQHFRKNNILIARPSHPWVEKFRFALERPTVLTVNPPTPLSVSA